MIRYVYPNKLTSLNKRQLQFSSENFVFSVLYLKITSLSDAISWCSLMLREFDKQYIKLFAFQGHYNEELEHRRAMHRNQKSHLIFLVCLISSSRRNSWKVLAFKAIRYRPKIDHAHQRKKHTTSGCYS